MVPSSLTPISLSLPIPSSQIIISPQGDTVRLSHNSIILVFFDSKINYALKVGLPLDKIIIDPGIGFGKTKNDNCKIIKNLNQFKSLNVPIMIGVSRKSFLQSNDDIALDRLETSLSVLSLAVFNGADIVRVHDVAEMAQVSIMSDAVIRGRTQ